LNNGAAFDEIFSSFLRRQGGAHRLPLSGLDDTAVAAFVEQVAGREAELRGYQFDVHISTRLVAGMVMSMALLDEWLFPTGKRRPSRQRIVNEMVAFVLHGLAHREAVAEPAEASG